MGCWLALALVELVQHWTLAYLVHWLEWHWLQCLHWLHWHCRPWALPLEAGQEMGVHSSMVVVAA